jgi:sugar transferase (PEP-CTERM/EpsH1 system associated)
MRILMVTNYLPYPQLSGGQIRIYNLLRRVADRHEVSLAALLESPQDADGVSHLRQFCARVETAHVQQRGRLSKAVGMAGYLLEGKPPDLMLLHSEELIGKIKQLSATIDFDIVQMESVMGLYLETFPSPKRYRSIMMFQNFTAQQFERMSHVERRGTKRLRAWVNGVTMGHWEPRYAERFDRCTTVSHIDRRSLLRANARLHVDVIPNGVDLENYQPLPLPAADASPSLMFIGSMDYPPCVDAAIYFCQEILPLIRQAIGAAEMWIVGRNPLPDVWELDGDGVHVTGTVEDVVPHYAHSTVCVVPLRAGGGTRLKIVEAMALGRPVVSTSIGCEGLDVVDGEHLLIADTPEQFAEKTVRLLRDRALYRSICANARRLVEAQYGWDRIAERLTDVYEDMVAEPMMSV